MERPDFTCQGHHATGGMIETCDEWCGLAGCLEEAPITEMTMREVLTVPTVINIEAVKKLELYKDWEGGRDAEEEADDR